jgi:dTDP-4-amino-4,6-dideoxygalactose transaminase
MNAAPTSSPAVTQSPATIGPVDLAYERAELGPALDEAVLRVMRSGQFVLGPEVERFEQAFAAYQHCAHGVGLASGTDALALALPALGVQPGDHVVTSPFTFFASAGSIAWMGCVPRFADVEEETGLIDARAVEAALDPQTTCVLPVHLYGQLADVRSLRVLCDRRKLVLLEDGAQAHGAKRDGVRCGELGDAAGFSFYPTKNLGGAGDGGITLTQREDVARRLRRMRDHGSSIKYVHDEVGTNSRLAALQAAVLTIKLPRLDAWNARRRANAARYDAAFAGDERLRPLRAAPGAEHTYHQYTLRVLGKRTRDEVVAGLRERGVIAGIHYPKPVHVQAAAAGWGYREGEFPIAECLAREVICLPVHPFLSEAALERVIAAVRACV